MNSKNMDKAQKVNKFFRQHKITNSLSEVDVFIGMSILIILNDFYDYIIEGKEPDMEDSDNE